MAEVLAAGIAVVVVEAATAVLGWLLLVEKFAEPVRMDETSCWEVEEAAVEVADAGAAFLMERTRVLSFGGWSGCGLEGQNCGP